MTLNNKKPLRFFSLDKEGFIINEADKSKIKNPWLEIVNSIEKTFIKNLGDKLHSIYILGNVGTGKARLNETILECVAVIQGDLYLPSINDFWNYLKKTYTFAKDIVFGFLPIQRLLNTEYLQHTLKVRSVCIYGQDLTLDFPKYKPDQNIIFKGKTIYDTNLFFLNEIYSNPNNDEELKELCLKIMNNFLISGFELCVEREKKFTSDEYTYYKVFSKYYPEQEIFMKKALEYFYNPISIKKELYLFTFNFGKWLVNTHELLYREKKLNSYKPSLYDYYKKNSSLLNNSKFPQILKFFKSDSEGFIVNESDITKIKEPWNSISEEIKSYFIPKFKHLIHSIYIYGDAAKGKKFDKPIIFKGMIVTYGDNELDSTLLQKFNIYIFEKYNKYLRYSTIDFASYVTMDLQEHRRFVLKTEGVCIYGHDLNKRIKPFPVNRDYDFASSILKKVLKKYLSNLALDIIKKNTTKNTKNENDNNITKLGKNPNIFYMDVNENTRKTIIFKILQSLEIIYLTGFEICIYKEKRYTNDIFTCYKVFSKYYPDKEIFMRKVYDVFLSNNENVDLDESVKLISTFGLWLKAKVSYNRTSKQLDIYRKGEFSNDKNV